LTFHHHTQPPTGSKSPSSREIAPAASQSDNSRTGSQTAAPPRFLRSVLTGREQETSSLHCRDPLRRHEPHIGSSPVYFLSQVPCMERVKCHYHTFQGLKPCASMGIYKQRSLNECVIQIQSFSRSLSV
jgi:hypothetical protein